MRSPPAQRFVEHSQPALGIFGTSSAKSRTSFRAHWQNRQEPEGRSGRPCSELAQVLAPTYSECHVFRAAVFSIVLTLAIGQNAALLCNVWCQPHEARRLDVGIKSQRHPRRVNGKDNCSGVTFGAIAFVREDTRGTTSAPDCAERARCSAVPIRLRRQPDSRLGDESGHQPPLEARPLAIALRI